MRHNTFETFFPGAVKQNGGRLFLNVLRKIS